MSDFIIATSSTSDLTRDWLDAHSIPFIPYTYTVGRELHEDDCREESRAAVYAGMRNGDLLKTSMINEFVYEDFFREQLDTGKDVIFLDMSEKMSVSFANSLRAAETVRAEYPERKLYVMDTRCVSGGLGLLVKSMVRHMEAGESFDEVIEWGEANKLKIAHRFTVDDLNYLKAGGRVSNASALVGSILSIKPVLYIPDRGTLDVTKKVRGRKAALNTILDGIRHDLSKIDCTGNEMLILHADCLADAELVRDTVKAEFPQYGDIGISSLGVVIGAHGLGGAAGIRERDGHFLGHIEEDDVLAGIEKLAEEVLIHEFGDHGCFEKVAVSHTGVDGGAAFLAAIVLVQVAADGVGVGDEGNVVRLQIIAGKIRGGGGGDDIFRHISAPYRFFRSL